MKAAAADASEQLLAVEPLVELEHDAAVRVVVDRLDLEIGRARDQAAGGK